MDGGIGPSYNVELYAEHVQGVRCRALPSPLHSSRCCDNASTTKRKGHLNKPVRLVSVFFLFSDNSKKNGKRVPLHLSKINHHSSRCCRECLCCFFSLLCFNCFVSHGIAIYINIYLYKCCFYGIIKRGRKTTETFLLLPRRLKNLFLSRKTRKAPDRNHGQ